METLEAYSGRLIGRPSDDRPLRLSEPLPGYHHLHEAALTSGRIISIETAQQLFLIGPNWLHLSARIEFEY